MRKHDAFSRRGVLKGSLAFGAGLSAPQIMIRAARGPDPKRLVFVSEESSPKAQAVYDRINADFTAETGIEVVMEYPGFTNIAQRVATLIAAGTPPRSSGSAPARRWTWRSRPARRCRRRRRRVRHPRQPAHGGRRRQPLGADQPAVHLRLVPQRPLREGRAAALRQMGELPSAVKALNDPPQHLRQHRALDQSRRLASSAGHDVPQERRALVRLQQRPSTRSRSTRARTSPAPSRRSSSCTRRISTRPRPAPTTGPS